jgi:hypothetical protein
MHGACALEQPAHLGKSASHLTLRERHLLQAKLVSPELIQGSVVLVRLSDIRVIYWWLHSSGCLAVTGSEGTPN